MHCLVDVLLIVSAQFNQFNLRYPVSPPTINRIEYFTRLKLTTSYNLVPRVFSEIASHDLEKQRRKDPGRSLFVLHKSSLDLGELRFDSNVSVTQCYHVLRMVVCNKLVRVYEQCFACMRQILFKVYPFRRGATAKVKKDAKRRRAKMFCNKLWTCGTWYSILFPRLPPPPHAKYGDILSRKLLFVQPCQHLNTSTLRALYSFVHIIFIYFSYCT